MKNLNLIGRDEEFIGKTFKFLVRNNPHQGYLRDFEDGHLTIMKVQSILRDTYSKEDVEELMRVASLDPVTNGEIVQVDGKEYEVQILGNYLDAGRLIPC